jgi:hypothetical protein
VYLTSVSNTVFDLDQIQNTRPRTIVKGGLAFCETGAVVVERRITAAAARSSVRPKGGYVET